MLSYFQVVIHVSLLILFKTIPNRTVDSTDSPGLPGQGRGTISVGESLDNLFTLYCNPSAKDF